MSEFTHFTDEVLPVFLKEHVESGFVRNSDDQKIAWYKAEHENEKAMILIVHGYCGFFGKFHETFYKLYQEGYSVCFMELRGHGNSEGKVKDQRIDVDSFYQYTDDMHSVVEGVLKKKGRRLFLLAHSMGGAAGALYLEQYPDDFTCAVLSSPMIQSNFAGLHKPAVDALSVYSKARGWKEEYAPKQHGWDNHYDFENSSTMNEERYAYQFRLRQQNEQYQTSGATWAWARAANECTNEIFRNAKKLKTPVLMFQSGNDGMVNNDGQNLLKEKCPSITLVRIEGAKHELYNGNERVRNKWFKDMTAFYNAYAKK